MVLVMVLGHEVVVSVVELTLASVMVSDVLSDFSCGGAETLDKSIFLPSMTSFLALPGAVIALPR